MARGDRAPGAEMLRSFVAVWPSQQVAESVGAVPLVADAGLRVTRPEQRHVTVAFLGDLAPGSLQVVGAALRAALLGQEPALATLGPRTILLGPGVLCVPVAGLDELAEKIQRALRQEGFELEARPFRGHLTLARSRRRHRVPRRLAGQALEGHWLVEEVTVVVSRPGPDGHRYEVVDRVALAGR
jgi:2'-5' RNA ligase